MNLTKYLLLVGVGAAAAMLLTSDKAKEMGSDLGDNAKKWAGKLKRMSNGTADKLAALRKLLSTEVEGLSDDARERIENILDGTVRITAKGM